MKLSFKQFLSEQVRIAKPEDVKQMWNDYLVLSVSQRTPLGNCEYAIISDIPSTVTLDQRIQLVDATFRHKQLGYLKVLQTSNDVIPYSWEHACICTWKEYVDAHDVSDPFE